MEKIAIRTKIVKGISSAIIQESKENEEVCDLINRLGKEGILRKVFGEEKDMCNSLFREYTAFQSGKESTYFSWMYVVDSKYGVVIDEHIYLYRYNSQIYAQHRKSIPWGYAESKKYLGDTWWMEDDEILSDLQKLPVVEFLDKYKGY